MQSFVGEQYIIDQTQNCNTLQSEYKVFWENANVLQVNQSFFGECNTGKCKGFANAESLKKKIFPPISYFFPMTLGGFVFKGANLGQFKWTPKYLKKIIIINKIILVETVF